MAALQNLTTFACNVQLVLERKGFRDKCPSLNTFLQTFQETCRLVAPKIFWSKWLGCPLLVVGLARTHKTEPNL